MKSIASAQPPPASRRGYAPLVRILLASIFCWATSALGSPAEGKRVAIPGAVPPGVTNLAKLRHLANQQKLDLAFLLPLRNRAELTNALAEIYNPASPHFHHYLSQPEFTARFGPSQADYDKVLAFAAAHHLAVTHTLANRLSVDLRGTVMDLERTLHVRFNEYRHPVENRTFHSPDRDPSIDLDVPLLGIAGLDNYYQPRNFAHYQKISQRPPGTARPQVLTGSAPSALYGGYDFRRAYVPGLPQTGAGQSVGLLEIGTSWYPSDVTSYESFFGLPNVPVVAELVGGFPGEIGSSSANIECSLDIEMAIAMAPGLSSVRVYEVADIYDDAIDAMASDNLCKSCACSWSWQGGVNPDPAFLEMAAQGQSFFAASGDTGAVPPGASQSYPQGDPNITMVGATELMTSGTNSESWAGEVAAVFTSGGYDTNYAIPSYQQAVNMAANFGSYSYRNYPDVSLNGTNIFVVAENGDEVSVFGTSASAPLWAGLAACANQLAVSVGQPVVGFINPAIYAMGEGSNAAPYATLFHDLTVGNTGSADQYPAEPGYDLATGWGTPAGAQLIAALGNPEPLVLSPSVQIVFAGGIGGPFGPADYVLTLTNGGAAPLNWTLGNVPSWLDVSVAGGSLTNGGAAAVVTISLDASATNDAAGSYAASLAFTNVTDGFTQYLPAVLQVVTPPSITSQPANVTALIGSTAYFSVGNSGTVASYQWYTNGVALTNTAAYSGTTSNVLTVANVSQTNATGYFVIVSNALGSATSLVATLAISNSAPVISQNVADATVLPGASASFSVDACGNAPFGYFWYYNATTNAVYGALLSAKSKFAGANAASLSISNCVGTNAGYYSVIISNSLGSVTSALALLNVTPVTPTNVAFTVAGVFGAGGSPPSYPYDGVTYDPAASAFFGTSYGGGANYGGTIFKVTKAGVFTTVHSFAGGTDGAYPIAGLCLAGNGDLYGASYEYATYDNGSVFQVTPGGTLSVEAIFNGNNGSEVGGAPVQGADGNLYGCALAGGLYDQGTLFKCATNGGLTNLVSFNGANGSEPTCLLIQANDGFIYGTAQFGGDKNGDGTIYKISTNGVFTLLAVFNGTNGSLPCNGVIQANDGNFYGTTVEGGAYDQGTIFQMLPNGTINTLYSFTGGLDGGAPWGSVIQGANGNLYGMNASGGAFGYGAIFMISLSGSFATVAQLDGYQGEDGYANLTQAPDGNIYGVTSAGGPFGDGVFFSITNSGPLGISGQPVSLTVNAGNTAMFTVGATGANPTAYQWLENGTNLLNGGQFSGVNSGALVIAGAGTANAGSYSVVVSNAYGSVTSSLASLTVNLSAPVIVSQPQSVTTPAGSMAFFSASASGDGPLIYQWLQNGAALANGGNIQGSATPSLSVSNVSASASYSVVVSNSLGSVTSVVAVLTVVPATPLAGVTASNIYSFADGAAGGAPEGGLIQGKDGYLYGTAAEGGSSYVGAVFRATLSGNVTNLYSFPYSSATELAVSGANPVGGLVQAPNGNLYGACQTGGAKAPALPSASIDGPLGPGTLFRLTNFTTLSALYSFAGSTDGKYPQGSLVIGTDNNVYGTAYTGGTNGFGSIFQLQTNGAFGVLYPFTGGTDGANPASGLVEGPDGGYYGAASAGGAYNAGTAFRIGTNGTFTVLAAFDGANGSTPIGGLVLASDGNFYGTTAGGGGGYGTVYRLSTNSGLTTLFYFAGTNGLSPAASLIQGKDGHLYGTCSGGGQGGQGCVFLISTNGAFAPLLWFDGFNGADPESAVVQAADGNLYGVASQGGIGFSPSAGYGGWGTLYKITLPVFSITASITATTGSMSLSWSGGIPPYQVLAATNLASPAWTSVGPAINATSITLPACTNFPAMFYEVEGN